MTRIRCPVRPGLAHHLIDESLVQRAGGTDMVMLQNEFGTMRAGLSEVILNGDMEIGRLLNSLISAMRSARAIIRASIQP